MVESSQGSSSGRAHWYLSDYLLLSCGPEDYKRQQKEVRGIDVSLSAGTRVPQTCGWGRKRRERAAKTGPEKTNVDRLQ